jgi:16S rRNA (guanine1207-N2)-methyltransferase
MTTLLYGRPPAVFDPPGDATQTSPLIPGATALETVPAGSVDAIMIYAPPGVLERRYTLALALRSLKPGGRLDVMAAKDKGGSRLKKELEAFGAQVGESAKAHHRRCVVIKGDGLTGLDAAIEAGAPRLRLGPDRPGVGPAGPNPAAAEGRGRRSRLRLRGAGHRGAALAAGDVAGTV